MHARRWAVRTLLLFLFGFGCANDPAPPLDPACECPPTPSPSMDAAVPDAAVPDAAIPTDGEGIVDAGLPEDAGDGGTPEDAAEPWDPDAVRIGWASADITPSLDSPVAIRGRADGGPGNDGGPRTADGVLDPITATAMAIESPLHPDASIVLVSVDMLWLPDRGRDSRDLVGQVRDLVAGRVPSLMGSRVILNATHTHAAPSLNRSVLAYYAERLADIVVRAWESRAPGAISYGLGHAVAGHNRITTRTDGESRMIGSEGGTTNDPMFSHIEGFEDHSVHLLYTFDTSRQVTGVVVNIACPAQVMRGALLSADYWHEVREQLDARVERPLFILPQVSAAGEVSTTVVVERGGEARMARLRFPDVVDEGEGRELRRSQIAHRIVETILDVLPVVAPVLEQTPELAHATRTLELPEDCDPDPDEPPHRTELHSVRIADIVMITNPFELYLDYGTRIKGRSPATQTFVVELAGSGTYLPTRRAVSGGGYGSVSPICRVGPEGGDMLVEESLSLIEEVFP
ncbi:MAG: hypothetical protein AB8I08_01900 [Sandaracinaceae bacterium]